MFPCGTQRPEDALRAVLIGRLLVALIALVPPERAHPRSDSGHRLKPLQRRFDPLRKGLALIGEKLHMIAARQRLTKPGVRSTDQCPVGQVMVTALLTSPRTALSPTIGRMMLDEK